MDDLLTDNSEILLFSDKKLIRLWQKGHIMAFDIFYRRHVGQLVNFAAQKTGRETAKNLVQDVFLDFFQKRDLIKPEEAVKAYLYAMLKHKIYNHYRQNKAALKYQEYLSHHPTNENHGTQSQVAQKELHSALRRNIDKLPPKCREVYKLSREEHLPHKEIAFKLNISVNTVEQHIRKALSKLKTSLHHFL